MRILRFCLDRRVLAVLGVIGLAVVVLAPGTLGATLPVLFLAACPLSMIVMAVVMGRKAMPATAATSDAESLRAELDELAARQRRLESELAATEATVAGEKTPAKPNVGWSSSEGR